MVITVDSKKELQNIKNKLQKLLNESTNLYLTIVDKSFNIDKIEYCLKNYSIREGKTVYKSIILVIEEDIKPELTHFFGDLYKYPTTYIYKNSEIELMVDGILAPVD